MSTVEFLNGSVIKSIYLLRDLKNYIIDRENIILEIVPWKTARFTMAFVIQLNDVDWLSASNVHYSSRKFRERFRTVILVGELRVTTVSLNLLHSRRGRVALRVRFHERLFCWHR